MQDPDDIADLRARLAAAQDALATLFTDASHDAAHAQRVVAARAEIADLTAALRAQGVVVGADAVYQQQGVSIAGGAVQGPVIGVQQGGSITTHIHHHVAPQPLLTTQERRNRHRMLAKVRAFWISGVLEQSLHGAALLALGIEAHPEAVAYPWELVVEQPNHAPRPLPSGTRIAEVFDDLAGELLILGTPGSGKTTMLLELARDLLDRAEQDEAHPIPVVFNLSTWAGERLPLAKWLVDELNKRYDVPRTIAAAWIDADAVLPLLDGLDEVALLQRTSCVEAINTHRSAHGLLPLVVCSRIADYAVIVTKLRLHGAILIQPLTGAQIDSYVRSAGNQLASLRDAIQRDAALRELAETPLLLSVMTLAYQDAPQVVLEAPESYASWRDHLFAAYIARTLAHRPSGTGYSPQQTLHYLAWLACGMVQHTQTVLYIEQFQPDWLPHRQRWSYKAGVILSSGLVGGLVGGLAFGLASRLVSGLDDGLVNELINGLVSGLGVGLAGGLVGAQASITLVEQLRWSWADALSSLQRDRYIYLVFGLVVGLAVGLVGGLLVGLMSGLIVGLVFVLSGGLSGTEIPLKVMPNQGIRRSAWNAPVGGLVGGLVSGLLAGLVVGLVFRLLGGLLIGLVVGLVFGLLQYGGLTCIQHLVLRILLWHAGSTPRNYIHFLDFAADRILLRKVGGGYIFIHRMLMEYFAALENDADASPPCS